MKYFPVAEDINPEEIAGLVTGEITVNVIAERLKVTSKQIERLIDKDPSAVQAIKAVQAEFEELIRLRVSLLTPKAISTLEEVMDGRGDFKMANAKVKAAEAIMDRGILPKLVRHNVLQPSIPGNKVLPSLDELMEHADNPKEAMEIVNRHRHLLDEIEALRIGAKEIIDVELRPED